MDTKAKRRGRPPGTGKDDSGHLMTMARRMAADPSLSKADALREVVRSRKDWGGVSDDTVLHRLRVKWNRESEGYLARARQEQAAAAEQERQRRAAPQPTFRELAAAAIAANPSRRLYPVAGAARAAMVGGIEHAMMEAALRQSAESRALLTAQRDAIAAAIAADDARNLAISQSMLEAARRETVFQAGLSASASLYRDASLAAGVDLRRMADMAGRATLDGTFGLAPYQWQRMTGEG